MPRLNVWRRSGVRFVACLGLLAFVGCQPSTKPATTIQVMGLKTAQMQYHVADQEASNWCWAACVQMVLSTQGIIVTQPQIVAKASQGHVWDRPGSVRDVVLNLTGDMTDKQGVVWRLEADAGPGPPSFDLMRRQFEQGLPLIIGYSIPGQEVGHAAVVTAVIYEYQDGQPHLHKILVRDPSPWLSNGGKRELTRGEFGNIWVHYLVTPHQL